MKDFHCCATCEHFRVEKSDIGLRYHCSRLGYETNPKHRFNCWSPKENVQKLIIKQKDNRGV